MARIQQLPLLSSPVNVTNILERQSELETAKALYQALSVKCVTFSVENAGAKDLQYAIFANALAKRLGPEYIEEANLYLRQFETPQIELFNLLGSKFPMVSQARLIANTMLTHSIKGRQNVVLIDIGMGTGQQEAALLRMMAEQNALPGHLTIVGIEPAKESLLQAENLLVTLARQLGLSFDFIPIAKTIEDFTEAEWNALQMLPGDVVINEAFAIHHIRYNPSGPEAREVILKRLKAFNPVAFVLSEPSSDHNTHCLEERYRNCWHHFGLVFQLIDSLEFTEQEKNALKVHFFGREIEDILGTSEKRRCERHETAEMWIERLHNAGFVNKLPVSLPEIPQQGLFTVTQKQDYASLNVDGKVVVAIMGVY